MRFTIIKENFTDKGIVIDFVKSLLGASVKIEELNNYFIIYHSYDNVNEIESSLNTLSTELVFNLYMYNSQNHIDNKINEEISLALELLVDLPVGCYNFKTALLRSNQINNKKRYLNYIIASSGVDETFIKGFIECDLNVSRASKILYIHRNTMLYKLDKLKEISGFDLRCFLDSYIVYNLIENK